MNYIHKNEDHMHKNIEIKVADITKESVCAIVNAANSTLMGGGGVDGAIHRAGGSKIYKECQQIIKEKYPNGLPQGEAVATSAGSMHVKYVIHTVGPIYDICADKCEEILSSCYENSLKLAVKLGCKDIAFPAISTGVYGYPKKEAAYIAYKTVKEFLDKEDDLKVYFIFLNNIDKNLFQKGMQLYKHGL
jgi:O-acetyl-ADP-ribose deacetylase (regulator of RNase III)